MKINRALLSGYGIGVLSPFIMIPIVLFILSLAYSYDFKFFWNQFTDNTLYTSKYLSLACIPNLIWFYLFLNREDYSIARGIILATLTLVPFAIYANFF